jgi:hypothetical protein
MARKFLPYNILALILLNLLLFSCHKDQLDPIPVPVWENYGPDSVTLTVTIQTQQGIFMFGSYVNLALNQDSLNNGLLVRRNITDGVGRVRFNRLYPRKYYSNCFAFFQNQSLYGSFSIQLPPYAIRDTVLIVH